MCVCVCVYAYAHAYVCTGGDLRRLEHCLEMIGEEVPLKDREVADRGEVLDRLLRGGSGVGARGQWGGEGEMDG